MHYTVILRNKEVIPITNRDHNTVIFFYFIFFYHKRVGFNNSVLHSNTVLQIKRGHYLLHFISYLCFY